MERKEILRLAAKFDQQNAFWLSQEKEIGDRLRATLELKKADLIKIIEWKFESDGRIRAAELRRASGINEDFLVATSKSVFGIGIDRDLERVEFLCCLRNGIGPSMASVILAFFDPDNYGVLDFHVWEELFNEKRRVLTSHDYVRLLSRLREDATRTGLQVRTVEKAYFMKSILGSQ